MPIPRELLLDQEKEKERETKREGERDPMWSNSVVCVLASIGNVTGGYSRSGTLYNEGTIILGILDIV